MSFTGTVENGLIRLPEGVDLPNGTVVTILPDADKSGANARNEHPSGAADDVLQNRTFLERFGRFAGMADDLPEDLSTQVDHYVHGQPKRR